MRPYFVNRLWTRCAASVRASFARDIGRTVASEARSYRRKKTVNAKNFTHPEHIIGIDHKLLTCYNLSTDSISIGGLDYGYIG